MKTIGLVGGIASGKSLVAKMLQELGAGVLDADREGHALLEDEVEVKQALRERWGEGVFAEDGRVDRTQLAQRVFGQDASAAGNRAFLEGLLHPRIRRRLEARRDGLQDLPAVVLDAPLLLEAGWDAMCDIVLMVDAPRDVCLERATARGWTAEEFARREESQLNVEEKRSRADVVLANDSTEADLRKAVEAFWQRNVAAESS